MEKQTMTLNSKVNLLLGVHAQLKIFHWQTKGYARHNAFAQTRDDLENLMDSFVEEAMGKYGRFTLDEETKTIELFNLTDVKPVEMVETICQSFIEFTNDLDPVDTNLLNIRDEMLGLFQKLKYLLTLE
jgi:DNA-binding ferritin-like protein